ncbi:MAG: glycosyltransferase family 9 protein [Ignavibacteriales bacterium]|nr:glycosyltransferase family 9 protein [Ignavibacteriales bacterium]
MLKKIEWGLRYALLQSLRVLARSRHAPPASLPVARSRILFIRQDRIGDVLVSTPLFAALKERYPDYTIDIVLSRNNHFVLENSPHVRRRWVYTKGLLSSLRLLRRIRAEHYDFVVDLMDNPSATSTVILLLAGGRWNVGLEKENAYAYDIIVPMKSRKESHIVERIAELLRPFGIDPATVNLRVRYTIGEKAEREVSEFLESGRYAEGPKVGINISAGSDTRFWGVPNYRELLRRLTSAFPGLSFILLGKGEDRQRLLEIAEGVPQTIAAPETSFDGFAAWISRLSILITPDTSAVHLAAAFDIPSVVLYVQSNPDLRIWEPYRSLSEALVTTVDDLKTISVSDVVEAFERLSTRMREGHLSGLLTGEQR